MTDQELLRQYARSRSEPAFAELVRRHVDHVHSASLRMTNDFHLAEDVTQAVFIALAQQARQVANCTAPSAWLHRTARNVAANAIRSAVRRRKREQEAASMEQRTTTEIEALWEQAAQEIDGALETLSQRDRDALMLRYFERKPAREIGALLAVSEEAAQKRLNRALHRLRLALAGRGAAVGATALATALAAHAVQAAPAGLATTISAGAKVLAASAGASGLTAKVLAMTTMQKTLIGAALAAAVGTAALETGRLSSLEKHVQSLDQQRVALEEQVQVLTDERDQATQRVLALRQEVTTLEQTAAEVPRLRGEVARLQAAARQAERGTTEIAASEDPFTRSVLALTSRAAELNRHLQQMPARSVPELVYATENHWLDAAREADLSSEAGVRKALSKLRSLAKNRFGSLAANALDRFIAANDGRLPDEPLQLKQYFENPVEEAILQRYEMLHKGSTNDLPPGVTWVMSEKAPVDRDHDSHLYVGPGGRSGSWGTGKGSSGDPDPEWASR